MQVVDFYIEMGMCMQSYPCCHGGALIYSDGSRKYIRYLYGTDIYLLHEMFGKPVPEHFRYLDKDVANMKARGITLDLAKLD